MAQRASADPAAPQLDASGLEPSTPDSLFRSKSMGGRPRGVSPRAHTVHPACRLGCTQSIPPWLRPCPQAHGYRPAHARPRGPRPRAPTVLLALQPADLPRTSPPQHAVLCRASTARS